MRRSFLVAAAVGAPMLFSLLLVGCGRPVDEADVAPNDNGGAHGSASQVDLQPVSGKPGATLTGKVTISGSPDTIAEDKELAAQMAQKADKACYDKALPEETHEQQWVLDGNGGVGNVVVWLQPPANSYFAVDLKDKTWPDVVELTQPHCAFIPHVTWIMPAVVDPNDPRKTMPSGQKFLVSNTAATSHNTKWDSNTSVSGGVGTLPANSPPQEVSLTGNNALYTFSCNIHPWMNAYVWVFNHPYAAVTKADGTYEIKNVPAGSKVRITAWHEMGPQKFSHYLTASKVKGDEMELKDGVNHRDFVLEVDAK